MSIFELTQELAIKLQNNDPEQLLALLKVWSFKPSFSEKNALLIYSQLNRPAVSLGSKKYWENNGFRIKPNEKPITIWVPSKDETDPDKQFVLKNRYDITQTSGSIPYLFNFTDFLKNMCYLYRTSIRIDPNNTSFVTVDNSHGRALIVNPTLSSDAFRDIVPFIIRDKIYEEHAKESVNAASAMLMYRATGNDEPLKALIQNKEVTFGTRQRDRAAYTMVTDQLDKWFPGLGKVPDKKCDIGIEKQELTVDL